MVWILGYFYVKVSLYMVIYRVLMWLSCPHSSACTMITVVIKKLIFCEFLSIMTMIVNFARIITEVQCTRSNKIMQNHNKTTVKHAKNEVPEMGDFRVIRYICQV